MELDYSGKPLLSHQWANNPRGIQLLQLAVKCRDDRFSGSGLYIFRQSVRPRNDK